MPHKCNLKKKGFRQMSMEADPYSLGADNNNFSANAQGTAESIYGDAQGAMMVSPVELKTPDSSQYEKPMIKQSSPNSNVTNTVPSVSVMPSNYSSVGMPTASTATGGPPNKDTNYYTSSNNNNQPSTGKSPYEKHIAPLFKPGGVLGKRTDQGFESRIQEARDQGRHAQVARLEKRYKKFSAIQDFRKAKTDQSHLKKEDRTGLAVEKRKDVISNALKGAVPGSKSSKTQTHFKDK